MWFPATRVLRLEILLLCSWGTSAVSIQGTKTIHIELNQCVFLFVSTIRIACGQRRVTAIAKA